MRAKEFILEYKLSVSKDADGVAIKATAGGKNLGHAEFFFDKSGRLDPQTVWVDERYYGQGIARDMYDHLKDLGYTIVRSWDQTDAGRGFWNKHRGKDATVWEDDLNEFAPSPDRDNNDDVPEPVFVLANRWWNAAEKQPQIESVLNSMGWSIHQVESEDDAVQLQHRDGTSYFISADDFDPDLFENFAKGIRAYHGNQGGIDTEQLHTPMWFTDSRPDAEYYAGDDGYVVVVDLDIQNPYVLQPGEEANSVLRRWQELQAQGYDGIYDRRLGDWIPFSRKQIRVISKDDTFMGENFADGKVKGKSRPGRVKRAGASCSGSVTDLRRKAKNSSGEKAKMYHWCANMKSGRKKNK